MPNTTLPAAHKLALQEYRNKLALEQSLYAFAAITVDGADWQELREAIFEAGMAFQALQDAKRNTASKG